MLGRSTIAGMLLPAGWDEAAAARGDIGIATGAAPKCRRRPSYAVVYAVVKSRGPGEAAAAAMRRLAVQSVTVTDRVMAANVRLTRARLQAT